MDDRAWNIARVTAVLLFVGAVVVLPLRADNPPRVVLEQCHNIEEGCVTDYPARWSVDPMGVQESAYYEGDVVPFRLVMGGLTKGATYTVVLEWATTINGKHAYDYLGSAMATDPATDPCAGVDCRVQPQTIAIPFDDRLAEYGVGRSVPSKLMISGGTFVADRTKVVNDGNLCGADTCFVASNPSHPVRVGRYESSSVTSMRVWLRADDTSAVLSWGAHIAAAPDWGPTATLVGATRTDYQMRVIEFGCSHDDQCEGDQQVVLRSSSVSRKIPTEQGQQPSTALEEELEMLLPQINGAVESPEILLDQFDSIYPGDIPPDGISGAPSDLPGTGSSVENFLMVAGVLVIIGWFLATVAAGNRPKDVDGDGFGKKSHMTERREYP